MSDKVEEMEELEEEGRSVEEIIEELERLQNENASNDTEILAAHWLTPLVLDLAKQVQSTDDVVAMLADSPSNELQASTIDAIRDFLFRLGFKSFPPNEDGQIPPFAFDARMLYIQSGAELGGIDPDEYAEQMGSNLYLQAGSQSYAVQHEQSLQARPQVEGTSEETSESPSDVDENENIGQEE